MYQKCNFIEHFQISAMYSYEITIACIDIPFRCVPDFLASKKGSFDLGLESSNPNVRVYYSCRFGQLPNLFQIELALNI